MQMRTLGPSGTRCAIRTFTSAGTNMSVSGGPMSSSSMNMSSSSMNMSTGGVYMSTPSSPSSSPQPMPARPNIVAKKALEIIFISGFFLHPHGG